MKKSISVFLFLLIISSNLFSQVTEEWVKRYNGAASGYDEGKCVVVDPFGNVYVTGLSEGFTSKIDYVTVKYNSSGTQQWARYYDGTGNDTDMAYAVAVDKSGNVYVTGYSEGINSGWDIVTIKYDSNGLQKWVQRYNGPNNYSECAYSIVVDNMTNLYVTGFTSNTPEDKDYITIKYDSLGITSWIRYYNGTGNDIDEAKEIILDNIGDVVVTGYSWDSLSYFDFTTLKYSPAGSVKWISRFGSPNHLSDYATSITADSSGNIFVCGFSRNWDDYFDYTTIKIDSAGVMQWYAFYDGPAESNDQAYDIAVDKHGNSYVTGYSFGVDGTWDCATVKYDPAGIQKWAARYDSSGTYVYMNAVAVDLLGNVYTTGACNSTKSVGFDYLTIKYNGAGIQQWTQRYDGFNGGPDRAASIAVDTIGNVFVTGFSLGNQSLNDIATIKYSQPIGIQPISSEIPNKFSLSQNYPNPFNPVTKIKFDVSSDSRFLGNDNVTLKIFDLLGREITTLVNQQLNPGTYEVEWDGFNYPSGVYFYRLVVSGAEPLTTEGYTETKRMVLLK